MIIEKHPLPNDPTPSEAPPSYDTLGPRSSPFRDAKSTPPIASSSTSSSSSPPLPPLPPLPHTPSTQSLKSPRSSSIASAKGKGPTNWFNFSSSRTTREVRTTVLGLVRDLVRQQHSNQTASLGILESCAEACTAYSLSLSSLLQEKSIENHTPLYWAIVKRPPDADADESPQGPDLLTTLLSFSTPLSAATVSEVRLACLLTSDQPLFQRLRLSPEFSPLSGTDEILLDATIPPDDITVEDVPGDEGAFAVNFEIVQFQKRMRVSKEIVLEFIARGRMWRLSFSVIPNGQHHHNGPRPGSWCLTLSLLEHSPPTWIDSRLLIPEPAPHPSHALTPSHPPTPTPSLIDAPIPNSESPTSLRNGLSLGIGMGIGGRAKPKPTISLRLKSSKQLAPPPNHYQVQTEIVISLEDSLMGSSLQYAGSSYIAADETLRARLEARLAKPEAECIIC